MNSGGVYDTSCVRGGLSGDGSTAFPQKPDDTIEIDLDLDELGATSAETKAAYQEIKDYVLKEFGLKVSNLYISQIKRKCGIEVGENYNLPSRTKNPVCSAFVFIRGQRRSKLQFYSK